MGSTKPIISILMPAKNAGAWIEDCLLSIEKQSFKDWECIIVNDHSVDNTPDIIHRYSRKNAQFIATTNPGKGIVDGLNEALRLAKGTYITRMDADDLMPPNKLSILMDTLQGSEKSIATGKVKYFSETAISEGYQQYENWLNDRVIHDDHWRWLYRECVIAGANWLTHRNNVYFEVDNYPEDYALVLHWNKKGLKISGVEDLTHLWREHPMRTSRNSHNYVQKAFFNLKIKHFVNNELSDGVQMLVLGKNQKSKICSKLLTQSEVRHRVIDQDGLEQIDHFKNTKMLVAVYPKRDQREKITNSLENKGLKHGESWWWI